MLNLFILCAQLLNFSVSGTLKDAESGEPIENATVTILEINKTITSGSQGDFYFENLESGTYTLEVNALGFETFQQKITGSEEEIKLTLTLTPVYKITEEVIITALRADSKTPVTQYNLNQKEIKERYFGSDIPTLIKNAPSVVSYSDAGNGIGYSAYRIRGIDQTRINLTINGIPVNDPETQGYFFNNFADLATSLKSIQIQRGVGTSTNGTASFGGAVNMASTDLAEKPSFGFSSGYGSYNSRRMAGEFQTGLIKEKIAFYGRLSNVGTDGYRDHSDVNVNSYFVSGGYFGKKSILKINSFGGKSNSNLAFLATEKSILDTNRTYNPLGKGNSDQFRQTFHQLQYTYEINKKLNFASSAYFVKGDGYFDLLFPGFPYFYLNMPDVDATQTATDVIASYQLDQQFYGAMAFLNYTDKKLKLNIGLHGNSFQSDHFMRVKWGRQLPDNIQPNHEAYFNTGYKQELSSFVKLQYEVTEKLRLFTDLQVRYTAAQYKGKDKEIFRDTFNVENMNWVFFNPKVGTRYSFTDKNSIYLSGGKTTREPTRVDYLGDDRANFDVAQSDVLPETVYNLELGHEFRTKKIRLHSNLYLMEFRNEIAATGALNQFGYSIRKNVPESFRRGIELDWMWQINKFLALSNVSTFSYNRIRTYTQELPVYDEFGYNTYTTESVTVQNVVPVLTPSFILNQGLKITPIKGLAFDFIGKYVSKMFLENTNMTELTVPSFFYADLRVELKLNSLFKIGEHSISFQANNFTNSNYFNSGTPNYFAVQNNLGGTDRVGYPSYFPAAMRNYFVTLNMKFF